MLKQNYETIIDIGTSKIRLAVFDDLTQKEIFSEEKKIKNNLNLKNLDFHNSEEFILDLIRKSEKKISSHLTSAILLFDSANTFSIDLSIYRKLDGKKINISDVNYLVNEASHLLYSSDNKINILHTVISKITINNKEFLISNIDNLKCENLIIEIKFICSPKIICNSLIEYFKKNYVKIERLFCSSYVKFINYKSLFENYKNKYFLDIGYEKSCVCVFDEKKLIFFKSIPIGGNHITKDISKVLKIDIEESEELKKSLKTSNITFSDASNDELNLDPVLKEKIGKLASLDLLKKIIFARIEEIIDLCFNNINISELNNSLTESVLVFTGEGSKILNKNSIYLKNEFDYFTDINFFEDTTSSICKAGNSFNKIHFNSNFKKVPKNFKKTGFFEKIFKLFD